VTRLRQQRVILTLCNFRTCNAEERRHLAPRLGRPPGSAANRSMCSGNSGTTWPNTGSSPRVTASSRRR
jgi:hypothetical protein